MKEERRNDQRLMTNESVPNPPDSASETPRSRWERPVEPKEAPVARHRGGMVGFSPEERDRMKSRWTQIQTGFVDNPPQSVQEADQLVASAIQRLSESFAQTRSSLESQWARGKDVHTEELRTALQQYRSFFDRLLGI
jgi:hypothetical protein